MPPSTTSFSMLLPSYASERALHTRHTLHGPWLNGRCGTMTFDEPNAPISNWQCCTRVGGGTDLDMYYDDANGNRRVMWVATYCSARDVLGLSHVLDLHVASGSKQPHGPNHAFAWQEACGYRLLNAERRHPLDRVLGNQHGATRMGRDWISTV